MNHRYADYRCNAPHYASPMPEQRMRDDYSESVSEWGYERPMQFKKKRIPMRRPYDARAEEPEPWKEVPIPQAYPKPGQDIPAEIYSTPAASNFKSSPPRGRKSHSPEERFFKKANHHIRIPNRPSGNSLHPPAYHRGDPTRNSAAAAAAGPSTRYRKTRSFMPSAAPSEQQFPVFGMEKHRAMAEYRRKETERHLRMQAQQYGYDASKEEDSNMDVENVHPKDQSKYRRTVTSFSNSRDEDKHSVGFKSVSEDTECTRSSSRTYEESVKSVNSKKEDNSLPHSEGSVESDTSGGLKVEQLKGISVQTYPGIDIKPMGEHDVSSENDVSASVEQKHMAKQEEAEYEWEIFELPNYFEMVREVMPRTLFTSQREFNRPNSKWYSYDCRARMYIRQQPSHQPIQPQHVAPPPHLTKEEFYEVIGE